MPDELAQALEMQLDTDPPLQDAATLAEVLSAARLFLRYSELDEDLSAKEYPLLQRLGIANHQQQAVTLEAHAQLIDAIRSGLLR